MPEGVSEDMYQQLAVLPPGVGGGALVTFPRAPSPSPSPLPAPTTTTGHTGTPLPRFSPPPQARKEGMADSSLVMSSSLNAALLVQKGPQR